MKNPGYTATDHLYELVEAFDELGIQHCFASAFYASRAGRQDQARKIIADAIGTSKGYLANGAGGE